MSAKRMLTFSIWLTWNLRKFTARSGAGVEGTPSGFDGVGGGASSTVSVAADSIVRGVGAEKGKAV